MLLLNPLAAGAVNLHALYTASCQREVGIILNVNARQVFLLNLVGEIRPVPRFEIIYFATFPLDLVPMGRVTNPAAVPLVEIKTWQRNEMRTLVRGWPVDFSKDKISFLSLRGSELVIDRSSIWNVGYDRQPNEVEFASRPINSYEFIHPYAFSSCPAEKTAGARPVKIFPQQLLSDPVAIKRELDRLADGHEGVRQYEADQQFYAVPELYSNDTSLGLWLSSGSRYGASSNRKNNFTPLLVNDFSAGPFGFQSHFRTGSGPMPFALHEEAQTHLYYRMKADYFHMSAMVDPNLLLVGERYKWVSGDLGTQDMRVNDTAFVEFGFDYGRWSLELGLGGGANLAMRDEDLFVKKSVSVPRLGFRYQRPNWTLHIFSASGDREQASVNVVRANLDFTLGKEYRFSVSALQRQMKFDGESDGPVFGPLKISSNAQTFAIYGYKRYKSRYWWGGSLAVERNEIGYRSRTLNPIYPKVGTYVSLSF